MRRLVYMGPWVPNGRSPTSACAYHVTCKEVISWPGSIYMFQA